MNRDFHIVSALWLCTFTVGLLGWLLYHYDQKTTYVYLPYVVKEYYPVEKPYVIDHPIILPCPGDIRTLEPWKEQPRKRQVAEGEE